MPHIFDLLHKDHQRVAELLGEIEQSSKKDSALRSQLVAEVQQELTVHARFEEKWVYPAIIEAIGEKSEVKHAKHEHVEALEMLASLATAIDEDEGGWKDALKNVKEAIEHHVKEEEEHFFPASRDKIEKSEAEKIGADYKKEKEKLAAE